MLQLVNNATHDLHIVLNSKMKNKLKKIAEERNITLSKLVAFVIKIFLGVRAKKRYYFGDEDRNRYPNIFWDTDMHVYLSKKDYRYLKKLHADLNFFSMAKLVRWLLEEFIKQYEENGWEWVLNNNDKEKNELLVNITNLKKWWKNQQLSHFEGNIKPFFKVIYNSHYQVLGFEVYF